MNLNPETCKKLSQHPNIKGLKEAGQDISHTAKVAALCGEKLAIYAGNDDQTVPVMSLGGKGVISVLANVMPLEMHRMCRYFLEGEVAKSREIQLKLLDMMNAMFMEVNPVPVKAALSMMGLCGEYYRLPLTRMEMGQKERLREIMKGHFLFNEHFGE